VLDAERAVVHRLQRRLLRILEPVPRVAKPDLRQDVQTSGLRSTVGRRDPQQDVIDVGLGVFDEDIEVFVLVEQPGVDQFELRILLAASPVLPYQPFVRIGRLRIFVEHPRIGIRRRRVQVVVEFLDVLAVIALGVGQPEQPLLQDRISAVPEGDGEAEVLLIVAEPAETVLSPSVGVRTRRLVWQIAPGIAVGAVIFAHRPPLPFAEVRPPTPPRLLARVGLPETHGFAVALAGHAPSGCVLTIVYPVFRPERRVVPKTSVHQFCWSVATRVSYHRPA
jgi:hypothetical protein